MSYTFSFLVVSKTVIENLLAVFRGGGKLVCEFACYFIDM